MKESYLLTGAKLKSAILAGAHQVISKQDHLNKINVFPVPDGDTGSNMAATFKSVARSLDGLSDPTIAVVTASAADGALNGARGNSGAILAQFFQGLSVGLEAEVEISLQQFADAANLAAKMAIEAIANPVEGTIVTVMRAWGEWVASHAAECATFELMIQESLAIIDVVLQKTTSQLKQLAKAKVVDAGAQGFVNFIEGIVAFIQSGQVPEVYLEKADFGNEAVSHAVEEALHEDHDDVGVVPVDDLSLSAHASHQGDLDYQYCTEVIVSGESLSAKSIRKTFAHWGDSMVVVGGRNKVKMHIHTNDPERLFRKVAEFGQVLETKADDMWAQYRACINLNLNRDITIVTDSSCVLPQEMVVKYNIIRVPLQVIVNDEVYFDRVNLSFDAFYERLKNKQNKVQTSQPLQLDFVRTFDRVLSRSKFALGIFLSSGMSGTCKNALQVAKQFNQKQVRVIDSLNVAGGVGLLVKQAAQCIARGDTAEQVITYVEQVKRNIRTYAVVADIEYAIAGGRVSKSTGKLAKWLRLLPIIAVNHAGKITKKHLAFGKIGSRKKLMTAVVEEAKQFKHLCFVIAYAGCERFAQRVAKQLEKQFHCEVMLTEGTPVLVTHSGPNSIAISFVGEPK